MRSLSLDSRASYAVAQTQEMLESSVSIEDGSRIRLHASNVNSVAERMQTAGRNIKEASAKVASWMCSHPLETAILAGGAMLASSSVLLGVGFGAKGAACACSAGFSGLSADANSTFAATASPAANSTFSTTLDSTSGFTLGATSGFVSTSTPCSTPLKVNCADLAPFSFNVARGQGFALSESSANTLLLHKAPSALVHDTEFVVDPKAFCVDSTFSEQVFSFHCDEDGTDYLFTAEDLQKGATVLHTGDCAVKSDRFIKQFFDCKKSNDGHALICKDNVERACKKVQNFKLTVAPLSVPSLDENLGSVFITEKGQDGKDEYRLFFTNHDKAKSKDLNVDVTTDCQKMLDVPLEFECSGISQSTKMRFTLRQNLTASDGQPLNFDAGACTFKKSSSNEERSCSIAFNGRSECGGALNISPTCDDKMIMFASRAGGEIMPSGFNLYALAPDDSFYGFEMLNFYASKSSPKEPDYYNACHVVRRKIKSGYSLKSYTAGFVFLQHHSSSVATTRVPEIYHSVDIKARFVAFANVTSIPEGFERPCRSFDVDRNRPEKKEKYSVPLCSV